MNVLFLSWEYPPNGSGIGNYVAEMSTALRMAGHKVIVLSSRAEGCPQELTLDNGIILRLFDRSELRSARVADLAVKLSREHAIDWIEVADHWGEGANIISAKNRPPVIVKMHYNDIVKTLRYAQAGYKWQKVMIDLACLRQLRSFRAEKFSIQNADLLLAPCRKILDETRQQGISLPSKTSIVPNPIAPLPRWSNNETEHPTLLLAGRLDMGKGLQYLTTILENLIREFPDLILELAGSDSYARGIGSVREWFEKQLGDMRKHVRFLGYLSPEEMNAAYRRAWVVIVPSRWDTFPHVVLESMIRGKSIVASDNGGMAEMLGNTLCKIAKPSDSTFSIGIAEFLHSSEKRCRAGKTARDKAVSEYSPERIAREYVRHCQALA